MTVLFDGTLLDAVTNGVAPTTGANGGPFGSVTETNATVRASTAQFVTAPNSMLIQFTGAGTAGFATIPSATLDASYARIYHSFQLYLDTLASTATVITLVHLNLRYTIYLFNSTGWKIGFTPVNNGTNAKTGSETTSAAISTGAWHSVCAIFQKVTGTDVNLTLVVDGVVTSTGVQTPGTFTMPSGANTHRVGCAPQPPFAVNASLGDKIYMDNINIVDFRANAPITTQVLGATRSLSNLALSINL